jgi:hypothetical protein
VLPARLSVDNTFVDQDNVHENACLFGSHIGSHVIYSAQVVQYTYDTSSKEMTDFSLVGTLGDESLASCEAKPLCNVVIEPTFPIGGSTVPSLSYTDARLEDNGDGTEERYFSTNVLGRCKSSLCNFATEGTGNADPRCQWRQSPEDFNTWDAPLGRTAPRFRARACRRTTACRPTS